MTGAELRDLVVARYRERTGVLPPDITVTGDEASGFTLTFSTRVFVPHGDADLACSEFLAAAAHQRELPRG